VANFDTRFDTDFDKNLSIAEAADTLHSRSALQQVEVWSGRLAMLGVTSIVTALAIAAAVRT